MSSTNKLLQSLSEDPQLEKQIGCMAGILQLFDRHQVLTGRRLYGHKRISGLKPQTFAGSNGGSPVADNATGVSNESKVHTAVEDQKQKISSATVSRSSSPEHKQTQQILNSAAGCANARWGSSDSVRQSPSLGALDISLQASRDQLPNLSFEMPHSSLVIPPRLDSSRSLHEVRISTPHDSKVSARRSVDTAERAAAAARGALKELSRISSEYMVGSQADQGSIRDTVRASFSREQHESSKPSSTNHKSGLPRDMSTAQYPRAHSSLECTLPKQMQVSSSYVSRLSSVGSTVNCSEVVMRPLLPKSDIPAKTCADINESLKLLAKLRESTPPYSTALSGDAYADTTAWKKGAELCANHVTSTRPSVGLIGEAVSFPSGNSLPRDTDRVLGRVSSYEPGRASSADVLSQGGYKARETPRLSLDGRGAGAQSKSDSQVAYHQKSYAHSYATSSSRSVSCSNSDCDTESLHAEKRNSFSSNVVAKLMGLEEMHKSNPSQVADRLHPMSNFVAPNSEETSKKGQKHDANLTFSQCGKYVSASFFPSKRRDYIKITMDPEEEEEEEEEKEEEAYLPIRSFSHQQTRGSSNIRAGHVKLKAGDRLLTAENVNHDAHPCYQPKNHHLEEDGPPHLLSPAAKLCAQIEEMQLADSLHKEVDKGFTTTEVHQSLMRDLEELRQLLGAIRIKKDYSHSNTGSHLRMLETRSTYEESIPQAEHQQRLPSSDIIWKTKRMLNEDVEAHSLNSQRILLESQNRRQRGFNGPAYSARHRASSSPTSRQCAASEHSQVASTKVSSQSITSTSGYPSIYKSPKRVNVSNACTSIGGMRMSASQSHTSPPSTATRVSPSRTPSNLLLRQGSNRSSSSLEGFSVSSRSFGNGTGQHSCQSANKQNKLSDKVSKSPRPMPKSKEQSKANLVSLRHSTSIPTERRSNGWRTGASTTARIRQQQNTEKIRSNTKSSTTPLVRKVEEVKRKLNFSNVRPSDSRPLRNASEDQDGPSVDKAIIKSIDSSGLHKAHPILSECGDAARVNSAGLLADQPSSSFNDAPGAGLSDINTGPGAKHVISPPAPIGNYQDDQINREIPPAAVTPHIRRNFTDLQQVGGDSSMTPPTCTLVGVLKLPQPEQEQENEDTESQGDKSTGSCEQPSPISVLEGPFYEDDRPSPPTTSKFLLKLQELEEAARGKDVAITHEVAPGTGCHPHLLDSGLSQRDTAVFSSHVWWTTDLDYVKQLLQIAGSPPDYQITSSDEQVVWKLRPLQFHGLLGLEPRDEVVTCIQPVIDKECKVGTWHHRLLFDAVNASIEKRLQMWLLCQCQPWLLANKHDLRDIMRCSLALQQCILGLDEQNSVCFSREGGKVLLDEVWEEIATHPDPRSKRKGKLFSQCVMGEEGSISARMLEDREETDEDSCDRVGYLLKEDIMEGSLQCSSFAEEQAGLHVEKGELCLDLERLIFKDLIDNTIRDLGIVLHPPTTTSTKRQLFVSNH